MGHNSRAAEQTKEEECCSSWWVGVDTGCYGLIKDRDVCGMCSGSQCDGGDKLMNNSLFLGDPLAAMTKPDAYILEKEWFGVFWRRKIARYVGIYPRCNLFVVGYPVFEIAKGNLWWVQYNILLTAQAILLLLLSFRHFFFS